MLTERAFQSARSQGHCCIDGSADPCQCGTKKRAGKGWNSEAECNDGVGEWCSEVSDTQMFFAAKDPTMLSERAFQSARSEGHCCIDGSADPCQCGTKKR